MPVAAPPTRKMPSTSPAAPPPGDQQPLDTTRFEYVRDSLLWAGVGIAGYGAAPMLGTGGTVSWAILGGGVTASTLTFFVGRRGAHRRDVRNHCEQALVGLMGKGFVDLKVTSWDSAWGTVPSTMRLRYAAAQPDGDPQWAKTIVATLSARTGIAFKAKDINRKRCTVILQRDTSTPAVRSAQHQRVETLITDLIPTSIVDKVEVNDLGEPVRIEVSHRAAHKLSAGGYQNRITRVLSASLPGRWRANWDTEHDQVVFSLRPEFPPSVWIKPLAIDPTIDPLTSYRKVRIPYAVGEDGQEISWAPAIDPHFLCIGATGSGKTSTMHTILETIAQYGWPIWVADAKAIEFLGFRSWPNVQVVASTTLHQMAVIHRAWQVMEKRYELITKGLANENHFEPLMVVVDEWADMRVAIQAEYIKIKAKGMPTKCPIFEEFDSIARKGRTGRVHLLTSLQRPDVAIFGSGESRDNFRCRTSMGRLSPQGAQMMWGDPSIGISVPKGKVGRGVAVAPDGRVVEVQCFRAPDPRKDASDPEQMPLLKSLVPAERRHPWLQIDSPVIDDLDCEEGSDPPTPTYDDHMDAPWSEVLGPRNWEQAVIEFSEEESAHAKWLSSPSTIVGVGQTATGRRNGPVTISYRSVSTDEAAGEGAVDAAAGTVMDALDEFEGYGPQLDIPVTQVQLGDLVEVDDGHWAVVDDIPDDDFDDEECLAIPWRDDADEEGLLSVARSDTISIRRLQEDA